MSIFKKLFGRKEKPVDRPKSGSTEYLKSKTETSVVEKTIVKDEPVIENKPIIKEEVVSDQRVFYVVGNQHHGMDRKVMEHIKAHKNAAYKTSTSTREVVDNYGRFYKYSQINSKKVKVVPEPDNPYDPDAIAVKFRGARVGYIKKEETKLVKALHEKGNTPSARIFGGPYKEEGDEGIIEVKDRFKMEIIFE